MMYVLEMRSTANWGDVRYREYTTSARKAELFKAVPKIPFTDSGHHIIPVVNEHKGRRLPINWVLRDHVIDAIAAMGRQPATCHCGKDGHPLHSTNCPVHGWEKRSTPRIENLKAEIKAQRDIIDRLRAALIAIRNGTIKGTVGGEDVVWFDQITTLHDFCDQVIDTAAQATRS